MQFLRDIFSCSKWTYILKIMYVKKRAFWKLLLLCSKHEPCLICVNCTYESNSLTCHLNQFLEFKFGETGHMTVQVVYVKLQRSNHTSFKTGCQLPCC